MAKLLDVKSENRGLSATFMDSLKTAFGVRETAPALV